MACESHAFATSIFSASSQLICSGKTDAGIILKNQIEFCNLSPLVLHLGVEESAFSHKASM